MRSAPTLDELELFLGATCSLLNEAAGIAKELPFSSEQKVVRKIADALMQAWDVRDLIFTMRPDLKPDFVRAHEENPEEGKRFADTSVRADALGYEGSVAAAATEYESFAASCEEGYYRRLALLRAANLRSGS